jgi:hypothetical protein
MAAMFSELLRRFMARDDTGARRLSIQSGVPEKTIEKWLGGEVRKPRHWSDIIRLAQVLHLDLAEANTLLQAARYPTLQVLAKGELTATDRHLLDEFLQAQPPIRASNQR